MGGGDDDATETEGALEGGGAESEGVVDNCEIVVTVVVFVEGRG